MSYEDPHADEAEAMERDEELQREKELRRSEAEDDRKPKTNHES